MMPSILLTDVSHHSDLRCRGHVLRFKLRVWVHLGFPAYNHQNIWVQCVKLVAFAIHAPHPILLANAIAQLLTVPPYAVATIVLCMSQYYSDRLRNRGAFAIASSALGAVGYAYVII